MKTSASLEGIKIAGYKCLKDVDIEFRDLNVLIGPNGSGKSSFFEVLTLLRESAKGNLEKTITDRGGMSYLVYRGEGKDIEVNMKFRLEKKHVDKIEINILFYRLHLIPEGFSYRIYEVMRHKGKPSLRLNDLAFKSIHGSEKRETALSLMSEADGIHKRIPVEMIKGSLDSIHVYSILSSFKDNKVCQAQTLGPASLPIEDGGNLFSVIYNMRTKYYKSYERLIDVLKTAFPDFDRLELPLVAGGGQATLAWHLKSFDEPIYPNQLSEGMRRFLFLSTILLSPELPAITIIDDPETGLHPVLLNLLAGLMKDASQRTKLFVATQSPELLRWFEPGDVLVVDRNNEDGSASFRRGDEFNLEQWLKEYTLGDLWTMGELGGRP